MRLSFTQKIAMFRQPLSSSGGSILIAGCLVIGIVLIAEIILHYRLQEEASRRNLDTVSFVSELRARTDRELNSVLYLGSGIVGYLAVRHEQLDPSEVDRLLGTIFGYGRHLRNLGVAVGYRLSYIYPLVGNEPAIGRDYREMPGQWPSVKAAVATRKMVVTGPVKLVQGGEGLILRYPVFVGDTYWGMLSTVVDIPSFQKAAFEGRQDDRFEFAVRIEEIGGVGGGMLWGRPELFVDPEAVTLEAEIPNGKWVYAARAVKPGARSLTWSIRGLGGMLAVVFGVCMFVVLSQRQALARLAGFDSLTDLPNRRLFDDRFEQAVRRLSRRGAEGRIVAIFLDLDGFKPINDRFGHRFGDVVLRTVAARIREAVRPGDTVARWAGDEFVVLAEDVAPQPVYEMIDRLRERIELPLEINGISVQVKTSIGAASYPDDAASPGQLLELADARMYEDKEERKITR